MTGTSSLKVAPLLVGALVVLGYETPGEESHMPTANWKLEVRVATSQLLAVGREMLYFCCNGVRQQGSQAKYLWRLWMMRGIPLRESNDD